MGLGRANKLLHIINRDSMRYGSRYELLFARELLNSVMPGDCVWDIGANIGVFTRQLAGCVTESGSVIAIEPFKSSFDRLQSETASFPQVRCLQVALGSVEQEILVSGCPESPSNTLVRNPSDSIDGERVRITTGDKLIAGGQPQPNVLKIDVEGFEEDVLWGFRDHLVGSRCSVILMEVHYGILERRGFLRAPHRIQSLLRDMGFRIQWIDH